MSSLGASNLIIEEVAGWTLDINTDMLVELINSMVGEEQFTPESVVSTPQKVISNYIDLHTQVQLHEVLG